MNRLRFILALGLLSTVSACNSAPSMKVGSLARVCGAADFRADGRTLQVLTPESAMLSAADINGLQARFRWSDGSLQMLQPSPKGCLKIPDGAGVIEVQSPALQAALARVMPEGEGSDRFLSVPLEKAGVWQLKLDCPSEGLFTSPEWAPPIRSQIEGQASLFQLTILLRDAKGQPHAIYRKALGENFQAIPETIALSGFAEGSYSLEVKQQDLTRDWKDDKASQTQTCPLTLIRSAPGLNGTQLVNHLGLEIFKKGQTLPLTPSDPRSRLYVCREPASAGDACEAQDLCKDPGNFLLVNSIPLSEAGFWQYFVQAENVVRMKSKPTCRKVFVSATAPRLDARWEAPLVDEKETILDQPQSLLSLTIAAEHPVVPGTQLEDALQCRAEFLIGGLLVRKGTEVTCVSGRCAGRNLEDWQPCDTRLQLSLAKVLETPALLQSQLRLSIRTQDGAGQAEELTKTLWLQKSRWMMNDVSKTDAYESAVAADGTLIFVNSSFQTVQTRAAEPSILLPPDIWMTERVTLVTLTDGSVISGWETNQQTRFAAYQNGKWEPLTIEGWPENAPLCSRLFSDLDGTFICSGRGVLARLNRERVLSLTRWDGTDGAPGCLGSSVDTVARLGDKDWVVSCRSSLHSFSSERGQWTAIDDLTPLFQNADIFFRPQIAEGALERDGQGRVWFLATAGFSRELAVAYVDEQGLHAVPSPLPTVTDPSSLTLARNRLGQLQFLDRIWDEPSQSWQVLTEIRQLFPAKTSIRVKRQSASGLLYESEHLMVYESAEDGTRAVYPWKGLDLPGRYAVENFQIAPGGETFIHVSYRSRRVIYQFSVRPWSSWGAGTLNLPDGPLVPYPPVPGQSLMVQVVGQGTFALEQGRWNMICEEPPLAYGAAFANSQGIFVGTFAGLLRCNRTTQSWDAVVAFAEEDVADMNDWIRTTSANGVEDAQGRFWFGKREGRRVYQQGERYHFLPWPEAAGPTSALMTIQGQVAMLGYQTLHLWNEAAQDFAAHDLLEYGIDPERLGQVKSTASGLLIHAADAEHIRVLDLNTMDSRIESALFEGKTLEGCDYLSRADGSLICLTFDAVYHQLPGKAWIRLMQASELDASRAALESDRLLWIPVKKDLIRVDLPRRP